MPLASHEGSLVPSGPLRVPLEAGTDLDAQRASDVCQMWNGMFGAAFCVCVCVCVCVFCHFRDTPAAYGGFQARGLIGAVATGLYHGHSNAGSLTH